MEKFEEWLRLPEVKNRLIDWEYTRRKFFQFMEKHPNKERISSYLNKRRFMLLLDLLDKSACISRFLLSYPADFEPTIDGLWYRTKSKEEYLREIKEVVGENKEDAIISEKLAYYRHRELMRIFSKEILNVMPLEDILREYSYLADALLEFAYLIAIDRAKSRYGTPLDEVGREAKGAIIGLGKLGSEELNYYSDIDIMFIYSSDKGKAGNLSLPEFFSKVFEHVVRLLTANTREGVPYKVDLDLRPFGKMGAIAVSLRTAELYYESYGRTWERFALLRARPVAGDGELGSKFMKEVVDPFVYRKSVDYSVIEEIRFIKSRIDAEAKGRVLKDFDVKKGRGGIRELEFAVQTLILLLGGRFPFLKEGNTFRAIWKLHQKGVFSSEEVSFLEEAYTFLRKLEHRIQLLGCIQTQRLPVKDIEPVAKTMGMRMEEFTEKLDRYRNGVFEIFKGVLSAKREEDHDPLSEAILSMDRVAGERLLKEKGFKNPSRAFNLLCSYIHGKPGLRLSEEERRKLMDRIPFIVDAMSSKANPDEALANLDKLMSSYNGKYIINSEGYKDLINFLANVFSLSSYLSTIIGRYPDLLEDVLTLYQDFPSKEDIVSELEKYKLSLGLSSEDVLRRLKRVWEVRIGLVYLMKAEEEYRKLVRFFESLTLLADVVMEEVWKFHGMGNMPVLMLSLGKYGSRELNFGSDLDLVFAAGDKGNRENISTKVQNIIRFITRHTSEGYLYDVDVRLRPMGSKGEISPSLGFYKVYFGSQARVWERFAWTRTRYIAGDRELYEEFESILQDFLFGKQVGKAELKEMYDIRMKLEENAFRRRGFIDLKVGKGGLMDAEFIVQYLVLKEKIREPSIIKSMDVLKKKYVFVEDLKDIYMFLRLVETKLRLSKERGTSVISPRDKAIIASSLNMEEDEFLKILNERMETLRGMFLSLFY